MDVWKRLADAKNQKRYPTCGEQRKTVENAIGNEKYGDTVVRIHENILVAFVCDKICTGSMY